MCPTRSSRIWVASPDEAATVAGLLAEFRDWMDHSEPPEAEMSESVARIIAGGDGEYLLGAPAACGAGERSQAAAVCQLRYRWSVWTSAPDAWLEDLFVREPARRSGLGVALVEAAVERARDRGCLRIELDVEEGNAPALALYQRTGFSLTPKGSGRSLFVGRRLR